MPWRAAPAGQLVWAEFSGEFLLFHRPSGKTHVVNATAARLLRQVLVEPLSMEQAASRLAACVGTPGGPDLLASVSELIVRLDEIGLVERIDT